MRDMKREIEESIQREFAKWEHDFRKAFGSAEHQYQNLEKLINELGEVCGIDTDKSKFGNSREGA